MGSSSASIDAPCEPDPRMALDVGRWNHLSKVLERVGPFAHPDFEPGAEERTGPKDVGRQEAEVATEFINSRITGCNVSPHLKKIQDFDESFYRQFHIAVCGLDSIIARRWMNGMLMSLLTYEDGVLDPSSLIPLVGWGTEGSKGNARVFLPGMTPCIECTLELYPPQKACRWMGMAPQHIQWVFQRWWERVGEFGITGVTYRLTQGVVKRIIPVVASTNSVMAAECATEVFKIALSAYIPLNNYQMFNDFDCLHTYTFEADRKENCPTCSQVPQELQFTPSVRLHDVLNYLTESATLQMKSPAIAATLEGRNKTLYLQTVASVAERTRPSLCKTLKELSLTDGQELAVAEVTSPQTVLSLSALAVGGSLPSAYKRCLCKYSLCRVTSW